ncbi:hypothetical protein D3C78_1143790 [compost metagenome]
MGELELVDGPGAHRQHVHLHLATGVLVFLQQAQTGLQLAIGRLEAFPVATVFLAQARAVQRAAHRMLEHGQIVQRLDQVIGRSHAQRFDRVAHHARGRNHDHGNVTAMLYDPAEQLQTFGLQRTQIADHQVGLFQLEHLQPETAIGGLQRAETGIFEVGDQTGAYRIVVIDDQQLGTDCVHESSRQTAPQAARETYWPCIGTQRMRYMAHDTTRIGNGVQDGRPLPTQLLTAPLCRNQAPRPGRQAPYPQKSSSTWPSCTLNSRFCR